MTQVRVAIEPTTGIGECRTIPGTLTVPNTVSGSISARRRAVALDLDTLVNRGAILDVNGGEMTYAGPSPDLAAADFFDDGPPIGLPRFVNTAGGWVEGVRRGRLGTLRDHGFALLVQLSDTTSADGGIPIGETFQLFYVVGIGLGKPVSAAGYASGDLVCSAAYTVSP